MLESRLAAAAEECLGDASVAAIRRRYEPLTMDAMVRLLGGQWVTLPTIHCRGTGPQNRLSSEPPRLSPSKK